MVTIEEKIKLFHKLLNQSMDKQLTNEILELEKNYKSKMQKLQKEVDKEAKEIEEKASRKVETKRIENLSKSKISIKKDIMGLKERYYYVFMDKFNERLNEFTNSNEYKTYLAKIISDLIMEIKDYGKCDLVFQLNKNDIDKYSDFIKSEITKNLDSNVSFKTNLDIKGGLITELTDKNIKIDSSIDTVLVDNKSYIMQTIFESLEVGDFNG